MKLALRRPARRSVSLEASVGKSRISDTAVFPVGPDRMHATILSLCTSSPQQISRRSFIKQNSFRDYNRAGDLPEMIRTLLHVLPDSTARAEKVYYLNKILHSVDWFCEIELPVHFMVEHPLGSVLGRANYGDFLLIYQGVSVGGNISKKTGNIAYPTPGNNIIFFLDVKVLGDVHIGNNVIFSADAYVINDDIPDDSIVFGMSPNLIINHEPEKVKEYMKRIWKHD